ncbi:uncharacterized protein TEOVI_000071700 [Trypanosoma equiperdum]|uniref:SPRY domain containing protein n=1 Tax=Trypanosoma equiperdum TaxID=5694 RepID=A0A1G4IAA0_TRYEQ|nr:hypothetical protein, conserved [Trypanosoma equiperdum]
MSASTSFHHPSRRTSKDSTESSLWGLTNSNVGATSLCQAPVEPAAARSWSGDTAREYEVSAGDVSGYDDDCGRSGRSKVSRALQSSGFGNINSLALAAIVQRACIEEEVFLRGRIQLQQLESWKKLRVQALQKQPRSLTGGCSVSQRVVRATPRRESAICGPPPHQPQKQQFETQLQEQPLTPRQLPLEWPSGDSNCRRTQLSEAHKVAATRQVTKRERRLRGQDRRIMERELQGVQEAEAKALREARTNAERIQVLEEQLSATQQTLACTAAPNRRVAEELQLSDRRVDVKQLQLENTAPVVGNGEVGADQKEYTEGLGTTMTTLDEENRGVPATRHQEAPCEPNDSQGPQGEQEEQLSCELQGHWLSDERITEVERRLREVACTIEKELIEGAKAAETQAKLLQHSQSMCEELQHSYREKVQEIVDQAGRYEAVLVARDASTAATTSYLRQEADAHRKQCRELQQLVLRERVAMSITFEAHQAEASRLRQTLDALQEGKLLLGAEVRCADLAASRQRLQEELTLGRQAEAFLRQTSSEVAGLLMTLTVAQQEQHHLSSVPHDMQSELDQPQPQAEDRKKQRQQRGLSLRDGNATARGERMNLSLEQCVGVNKDGERAHRSSPRDYCEEPKEGQCQFRLSRKNAGESEEESPNERSVATSHALSPQDCSVSRIEHSVAQRNVESAPLLKPISVRPGAVAPELFKHLEGHLESHLHELETRVTEAIEALSLVNRQVVPQQQGEQLQAGGSQRLTLTNSIVTEDAVTRRAEKTPAGNCVVKLLDAVSALNVVLPYFDWLSCQGVPERIPRRVDKRLEGSLRQQLGALRFIVQDMEEKRNATAAPPALSGSSTCSGLSGGLLIYSLTSALKEGMEVLSAVGYVGKLASPTKNEVTVQTSTRSSGFCCPLVATMLLEGHLTPSSRRPYELLKQLWYPRSFLQSPRPPCADDAQPRHTFAAVGGRLELAEEGRSIRRLPLPPVVDIMSCSALGALDHQSFSVSPCALSSLSSSLPSPLCFTYTVRVVAPCGNVLMGFSDRRLPLEVFAPALNHLSYSNSYWLHLGRGTLYCPRLGIADLPYSPFARSNSIEVNGEVTCVLDMAARTIRFKCGDADCGVAFGGVDLSQPLFPAFEFDCGGGALKFV